MNDEKLITNLTPPAFNSPNIATQVTQMRSYLYKQNEELRFILGDLAANIIANRSAADGGNTALDIPNSKNRVVEEGDSSIWHYRKWSSGTAECWSEKTFNANINQAVDGWYYVSIAYDNYPSGFFATRPQVYASVRGQAQNLFVVLRRDTAEHEKVKPQMLCMHYANPLTNVDFNISVFAIGKWK